MSDPQGLRACPTLPCPAHGMYPSAIPAAVPTFSSLSGAAAKTNSCPCRPSGQPNIASRYSVPPWARAMRRGGCPPSAALAATPVISQPYYPVRVSSRLHCFLAVPISFFCLAPAHVCLNKRSILAADPLQAQPHLHVIQLSCVLESTLQPQPETSSLAKRDACFYTNTKPVSLFSSPARKAQFAVVLRSAGCVAWHRCGDRRRSWPL